MKHENRRLERLLKKSAKVDALDLTGSRKRSRSIADSIDTEVLQVKFLRYKSFNSKFLQRMMFMFWNNNFFENNVTLFSHKNN